jgi:hypothetical protein
MDLTNLNSNARFANFCGPFTDTVHGNITQQAVDNEGGRQPVSDVVNPEDGESCLNELYEFQDRSVEGCAIFCLASADFFFVFVPVRC